MSLTIRSILSKLIITSHLLILYLWIFHWRALETTIGLFVWICSIVIGFTLSYFDFNEDQHETLKRVVKTTTWIIASLAVFSLFITYTTNSMP